MEGSAGMKVCIVGGSGHVGYVLKGLKQHRDIKLCGIGAGPAGEDIARLHDAVAAPGLHAPPAFTDYRVMFDTVKPDLVAVAPVYADNARVSIEALSRGIHVFSEKPLATTLPELAELERTYRAGKAHLSCMLGLRYNPAMLAGWEAVRAGAIGEVRLMTAQKSYKLGVRPAFYADRARYGGTIPWVGSHGIDLLLWFGAQPVETVYATHSSRANGGNGSMELTALCHFTFAHEVFGALTIDYLRPAKAPTHGDDRIRVAGTAGVLEVREEQALLIDAGTEGTRKLEKKPERSMFAEFIDQIRGQGRCLISADESLAMTRACLLARDSADQGRAVPFT